MKKLLIIMLSVLIMTSLVGCKKTDPIIEENYPIVLTDQSGKEVTINKKPEKIVSGYYISTSAVIALGLKDKLVGIEARAKSRNLYKYAAEELINLPSVGTAKEFDLEGCIALQPDLVILPLKLSNAGKSLEELGISVILVNPENDELLQQMITLIGKATSTEEKASELLKFQSDVKEQLTNKLKDTEAVSVYLAGNSSLLSTAGGNMYQNTMISLANGENVAKEITDSYWVEISYEQLLAYNPEYIVLASDAAYSIESVLSDPALSELTAVKEGKVIQLENKVESWDSPVASAILGSLWLASKLHPEVITAEFTNNTIETFYKQFYGFNYSEK